MPAFSRDLERTLQRALSIAGEKGPATQEHLALALVDDSDVKMLLRGCGVDVPELRTALRRLVDAAGDGQATCGATADLPPAVVNALAHAQSNGRRHIAGPHVLIELLAEPGDEAAEVLRHAGVTYLDATRYVCHGLRKPRDESDMPQGPAGNPDDDVRVLLLNDDYTPWDFVVAALQDVFGMHEDDAVRLMLAVHQKGFASCGTYTRETAAAKVAAVAKLARDHQHPLDCVMEPLRGPSDALLFTQPRTIVASGPGDRQRA